MAANSFTSPLVRRLAAGVLLAIALTVTAIGSAGENDFEVSFERPAANELLTQAVRWEATVTGWYPDRVEFFVDGDLHWTEHYGPYVFNGDNGELVPSALGPGSHTLKAVAYHGDASTSTEVTVAVPGLEPPADNTSSGGTTSAPPASQPAPPQSQTAPPEPQIGTDTVSRLDLAAGKQASASSVEDSSLGPQYAVDGDHSSRWSSAYADNQWWQVDLGSATMVDTVVVNWEDAFARSYRLQVSTDGRVFSDVATESLDAPGVRRTSFSPVTARYVRLLGVERATGWGFSAWDIEVYGPQAPATTPTPTPTPPIGSTPSDPAPAPEQTRPPSGGSGANLAVGKPTSASSIEEDSLASRYAADGNRSTRWSSAYANNQWWQVDLGSRMVVNRVRIDWEFAYGARYTVQVSSDGSSFQDAARESANSPGPKETSFSSVSARYVRIMGLRRGTSYGFSAWEIEVYGPETQPTPQTPPTAVAPTAVALPAITGSPIQGSTLTSSAGTWNGSPTSFAYAWQRCNATGTACTAIAGATAQSYQLAAADVGATLRSKVTASNTKGAGTATSAQTGVIAPPPTASGNLGSRLPARLAASAGQHYYVSQSGSDSNPGTISAPWRTIGRAWSAVPAGAVINVRAGTYSEQTFLTGRSAGAGSPITLRAYQGESVTLRNSSGVGAAVYIEGVNGLRVEGFSVTNPSSDGIKVTNSSNVEIVGNTIYGAGNQAILVIGNGSSGQTYSENVQLWSNRIYGNGGASGAFNHGIYYGASSDPYDGGTRRGTVGGVIANNVVYDQATGYLIQVGPQADGLIITNNTLTGAHSSDPNTGSAIRIWGTGGSYTTRNVVVANNAVAYNANMSVHADALPGTDVRNNLSYANQGGDFGPASSYATLSTANITGLDPLFMSLSDANFRPRSGSPLIGRADPAYAPRADVTGSGRTDRPTIGAFEG